ncbi:cell wall metabolism sensor histidine kinase WalK [Streptomyces sp. NL15-2K]|uniref:sensor histidine kinase n=1 Tax=Streptomyces sp. NL15-2K TaxID=376149 RepID=UPI000FF9436B|nr:MULTISPECIES: HAMP domain-containing sensor histidine kinase [Actinomycetes]WKX06704.1 ATP-binding protein [Kutzneria buriramensis]GCB43734.1 osmosensitive K+ channel histidine kinase kdpD [Streptomyces sp. NL15-2K]
MRSRFRRWPLRARVGVIVTALCAGAIAVVALTWLASGADPVAIVTAELVGLCVVALVTTALVRRELRPLEQAAAMADSIAAGDLARRLPEAVTDPTTEVGRLAEALNRMVDQIQAALTARERSESRMRQFVADASHELRTPLQSLRGYAELHQRGALPDMAAVDEAMARVLSEVHRMTRLVEALLMLARFDEEYEEDTADLEPVDLSRIVDESCRDALAAEPGRPLEKHIEPGASVLGDEAQLRGLLANLLGNVRMHTPATARCVVALSTSGDEVTLLVQDEGPGVPSDAVAHVFDRFYRADKSRSRASGGSGLGLSIVAAIAEVHHARVELDSTPGKGTRVYVVFPVLREQASAHA